MLKNFTIMTFVLFFIMKLKSSSELAILHISSPISNYRLTSHSASCDGQLWSFDLMPKWHVRLKFLVVVTDFRLFFGIPYSAKKKLKSTSTLIANLFGKNYSRITHFTFATLNKFFIFRNYRNYCSKWNSLKKRAKGCKETLKNCIRNHQFMVVTFYWLTLL